MIWNPLGLAFQGRCETCLNVGPKQEGCQCMEYPSLRQDGYLPPRKVSHERTSPGLDMFGYTCPVKDGNDQILKKIGITSLGMALTIAIPIPKHPHVGMNFKEEQVPQIPLQELGHLLKILGCIWSSHLHLINLMSETSSIQKNHSRLEVLKCQCIN